MYYKGLLSGLNKLFPNQEKLFKEIGHEIVDEFEFYPMDTTLKDIFNSKSEPEPEKLILKEFGRFYPHMNIFQENAKVEMININESKNKAIYRISNSEFLQINKKFIYHYYIGCAFIESSFEKILNKKITCNVEKVKILPKQEDSFIEISIQIE